MSPSGLRRYRAERLLRKDFAALRAKVLAIVRSQLRAKSIALDPADLEACYAQAWHGLYATVLEGEVVENPSAWLVLVTFRRAIDEHRSASRSRVGGEADSMALGQGAAVSDHDLAAELDDRARLRQVFEGMRWGLSERECEAASLCYLQGLSRADAAARMGISEARMRKLMEGAGSGRPGVAGKVGGLLDTIKAGAWCEQQSSLIRAFAFGVLDPEGERHALALAHCRECPACRAYVASLRGLASVLPLPLLSPLALTGAGPARTRTTATGARLTGTLRTAVGIGRSAAGSAWSGIAGSLTAKLAVTAVVGLGAGYALLGSRAHGSPRGPFSHLAAPSPVAHETLARTLLPPLAVPTRSARSRRLPPSANTSRSSVSTAARVRFSRTASRTRFAGGAISGEFRPERLPRERVVAPLVPTPVPARSSGGPSRAAGEFGIE